MNPLQVVAFLLAAGAASLVALSRDPLRQIMALSLYGLVLGVLFLVLQAPDVCLSELAVGSAALPLVLLITLAKVRQWNQ